MVRLRADQKLFLSYLALIAAVVVALTLGVGSALRRTLSEQLEANLHRELLLARDLYLGAAGMAPDALADRVGQLSRRRATLVAPDGRVLGDSELSGPALARMEGH